MPGFVRTFPRTLVLIMFFGLAAEAKAGYEWYDTSPTDGAMRNISMGFDCSGKIKWGILDASITHIQVIFKDPNGNLISQETKAVGRGDRNF